MEQKKLDWFEDEIIKRVKAIGENDGVCKIVWLNDLNGVVDIECEGHHCTDLLGVYVGGDNRLSISVFSQDDMANLFIGLGDLPDDIINKVYGQVFRAYELEKDRLLDITSKYLESNGGYYCFPDDTHADIFYCGEVCDNLLSWLELNEFGEMFICTYIDGTEIIDPFCDLGCDEMKKVLDIMEVKY